MIAALRAWWRLVVADEIRDGRPQPRQWSPVLQGLGVLGAAAFAAMVALALAAPLLRRHARLTLGTQDAALPAWSLPLLVWAVLVAVVLVQLAGLRAHWALSVPAIGLSLSSAVGFTLMSADPLLILGSALLTLVGTVVLTLARRRRPLGGVDVLVTATVIVVPAVVGMAAQRRAAALGFESILSSVSGLMLALTILAGPALYISGVGIPAVTVRAATALAPAMAGTRARWAALVLGVVLTIGWLVVGLPSPTPGRLGSTALVAGLFVLGLAPLLRRRAPEQTPVQDAWAALLYPLALGFMAFIVPVLVASVVSTTASMLTVLGTIQSGGLSAAALDVAAYINSTTGLSVLRLAVALVALLVALRRLRRGDETLLPTAAAFFAIIAVQAAARLSGEALPGQWSLDWLGVLALAIGAVLVLVQLARRRFSQAQLPALITLLALLGLYPVRHLLGDPLGWLLGSVGLGALLFGLGWRVLTDGSFTRHDSNVLPRDARICLYLANLLLAALVLAYAALSRTGTLAGDTEATAVTGELLLGGPLWLGALSTALLSLARSARPAVRPARVVNPRVTR